MQDKKKRFNNNNAEIRSAKMALDLLPWGPEKKNEVSNYQKKETNGTD